MVLITVFYLSIPSVSSLGNQLPTCLIPLVSPFCSIVSLLFSMLFSHPVFHITDRVFCRVCIFRFYKRINSLLNYFLTCWILHPSSYFDILVHLSSLVSSVFCKLLFLLLCRIKCLCRSLPAFFFFTPCIFIFVWRLSVCSAVCLGKPVYLDSF